jgi:hypothetical protein
MRAAGFQLGERDALVVGEAGVAGPEDGPADGLGELSAARFGLAHLVDGGGEELDDVEPVDGDGGLGEAGGKRRQEGRRHVADDLGDAGRLAAMAEQEGTECGHASLALARRGEDHRLVGAVHVDEHGDVVVAALGGRLVQADGAHRAEIELADGARDVVLEDAPQPLVGDAHEAGRRRHRHLARQDQRRLLEQQRVVRQAHHEAGCPPAPTAPSPA